MAKYALAKFRHEFPTADACLDWLFASRWGQHGPTCTCGKRDGFHRVSGRRTYACAWCGAQISPTAGTIFDHSPTPLTLWFYSMFLMCASRNGVAAKELERQLGVTYKTAWRMAHAIRRLMDDGPDPDKLKGVVEGDETYIGGVRRGGKRGSRRHSPVALFRLLLARAAARRGVIGSLGGLSQHKHNDCTSG